jgi:hypothetical protein
MTDHTPCTIRIVPGKVASKPNYHAFRWLVLAAAVIGFVLMGVLLAFAPSTVLAAPVPQGFPTLPGGIPTLADRCGDGFCGPLENGQTCPQDCAAECGDGVCGGDETFTSCAQDCMSTTGFCGDQRCEGGETVNSCARDCTLAITATLSQTVTTTPTETATATATSTETSSPTSTESSTTTEEGTPLPADQGEETGGGGFNPLLLIGGGLALLVLLGGIGGALLLMRRGKPKPRNGGTTAAQINEYDTMPGMRPDNVNMDDQTHAGGIRTGRYDRTPKEDFGTTPDDPDDLTG